VPGESEAVTLSASVLRFRSDRLDTDTQTSQGVTKVRE